MPQSPSEATPQPPGEEPAPQQPQDSVHDAEMPPLAEEPPRAGARDTDAGTNVPTVEEASQPAEIAADTDGADLEEAQVASISQEKQRRAQQLGRGIWLALAIGAAGLMLMLLLPWAQINYLNPLQPLEFAQDGSIQFTRDEVIRVNLQGFQLLTLHLAPLLIVFLAASLLFGAAIYWRQTHFLQQRAALFMLALGLLVGLGFPAELLVLLNTNQQVDWNNSHATIEANHGVHTFSARDGKLYLCTPQSRSDPTCDNDYSNSIILNAGLDWVEINGATGKPLIQGHAQSSRNSSTSQDVTTSGYAIGPLGFMNPSLGYWGAWLFGLWTLLCTLALANRLRKTREKQARR
jgi:hypothetical protein